MLYFAVAVAQLVGVWNRSNIGLIGLRSFNNNLMNVAAAGDKVNINVGKQKQLGKDNNMYGTVTVLCFDNRFDNASMES